MDSSQTKPAQPANAPAPASPSAASPNTEADRLEKVLPRIRELAQEVGGFGKLADIARELEQRD